MICDYIPMEVVNFFATIIGAGILVFGFGSLFYKKNRFFSLLWLIAFIAAGLILRDLVSSAVTAADCSVIIGG